jgi:hypothetical protein
MSPYIEDVLNDAFTDSTGVREKELHSDKPKKSQSITFRLESNTIDELQREADQNQVSLNVLVNQALKRYSDWDRYENRIGMMPVPKVMLTLIDKAVDTAKKNGIKDEIIGHWKDQLIKQAAEVAFSIMKDAVWFMKKQYNLWVVLGVLQDYMKVSGINAEHRIEGGGKHVIVIKHELGDNWSLFTKELLKLIFDKLAKVRAEVNVTPNTTIAEVILDI